MVNKIILDLCGGTGAWSKPYAEAGYDVRVVTLPRQDVRTYRPPAKVHGVLAAPPCTCFSSACMVRCVRGSGEVPRWEPLIRTPTEMLEAIEIVAGCLRIILKAKPKWWALENPPGNGQLKSILGEHQLSFQPWQYGDPWTKRTYVWGRFWPLRKHPVSPIWSMGDSGISRKRYALSGKLPRKFVPSSHLRERGVVIPVGRSAKRAITPPGFARAFFEANP